MNDENDFGWASIQRKIKNNWTYQDKPFNKSMALIDLILMVNHKTATTIQDGGPLTVIRGDTVTSLRKLAIAWGWSITKVSVFLNNLEADGTIIQKRNTKKTVITLINYGFHQSLNNKKDTEKTLKRHRKDTEKTLKETNNNGNNDYNVNNEKKKTRTNPSPAMIEIMEYFNMKYKIKSPGAKGFQPGTRKTMVLVNHLLNADHTVEDFKKVISFVIGKWWKNGEFCTPSTVFKAELFEKYLNQAGQQPSNQAPDIPTWEEMEAARNV